MFISQIIKHLKLIFYEIFIQIISQELKLIITQLMLSSDINCQELLHDL